MDFQSTLSTLFSPIIKIGDWIRQQFNSVWGWVISFLVFLMAPLKWVLDQVTYWVTYLNDQVLLLTEKVLEFWENLNGAWANVATTMATANAIFPLSHLFLVTGILVVLWAVAILYRVIKSWVPTVA